MKICTPRSNATLQRSNRFARFLFSFAILAASILQLTADGIAQSLTVGTASALPGDSVDIAVSFTSGATDVSTLQFDLTFPGSLGYVSTATGSAASSASKSATGSEIAGGVRVLVFGLNQNAIRPDPDTRPGVVAVVRLDVSSGTAPGILPLSINAISAADPLGRSVPVSGSAGSVTVNGPPDTTNPSITITSPTSSSTYTASSTPIDVKGTASDNVGLTKVTWSNDRGGSGTASGTTSWSIVNVALKDGSNKITVTAHDAAGNTHSDRLTVSYSSPDGSPSITITSPTSGSTYTTGSNSITLDGTASDDVRVTDVTWANDQGGRGDASGTTDWNISGIPLQSGTNVITVTARDAADNTGTDTLTVTYNPTNTGPSITITSPTTEPSYNTPRAPISLSGTAAAKADSRIVDVVWANDRGGRGNASGNESWSIAEINLELGANVITVTAYDAETNTASDQLTVHYEAGDSTKPTITIMAPTSDPTFDSAKDSIVLSGDASDNAAVMKITWKSDRGGSGTGTVADNANAYLGEVSLAGAHWTTGEIGLKSGTNVITVMAYDSSENTQTDKLTVTFNAEDTTPPTISNIEVSNVGETSATVSWTTSEAADAQVEYGPNKKYGSSTSLNATLATQHTATIQSLEPGKKYRFRVRSRDKAGNLAVSRNHTFKTDPGPDRQGPRISRARAWNIRSKKVWIIWATSEKSDSRVEFGVTRTLGESTPVQERMTRYHRVVLDDLAENTRYFYSVTSSDTHGNASMSDIYTFKTDKKPVWRRRLWWPRLRTRFRSRGGEPGAPEAVSTQESPSIDDSEFTGLAIANLGADEATISLTSYDTPGDVIEGEDIFNPVVGALNPGQQIPMVDTQAFGDGLANQNPLGWISMASTTEDVAGFFLMFNESLSILDGADVSHTLLRNLILSEIEEEGFTQIHLANPSEDSASVHFDLVASDGSVRATTTRTINGHGAVAEHISDLFPDLQIEGSDYLRVISSQGVAPFEMLGKQGRYVEGLNGQDAYAGSAILYSPQYVVGGSWRSTLSVINLDATPGSVTFRLIGDNGAQIGPTKILPISGFGKISLTDQSFFTSSLGHVTQGYVEIRSTGVRLSGSVVFGDPARETFGAALPLAGSLKDSFVFSHVASNETFFTGLAILNPNESDAIATIEIYQADGTLEYTHVETIRARHRQSKLLTEYFPALVGEDRSSGYIKVIMDQPVASFSLFGTNDLSVLSAIPAQPVQ